MSLIVNLYCEPVKGREYLAGEAEDRLRMHSKHQGHICTFTVIKAHDGELFLVPNATVIAAVKIEEPGEVYTVTVGETIVVDNVVYVILDDVPLGNPRLAQCPPCFRPA